MSLVDPARPASLVLPLASPVSDAVIVPAEKLLLAVLSHPAATEA